MIQEVLPKDNKQFYKAIATSLAQHFLRSTTPIEELYSFSKRVMDSNDPYFFPLQFEEERFILDMFVTQQLLPEKKRQCNQIQLQQENSLKQDESFVNLLYTILQNYVSKHRI